MNHPISQLLRNFFFLFIIAQNDPKLVHLESTLNKFPICIKNKKNGVHELRTDQVCIICTSWLSLREKKKNIYIYIYKEQKLKIRLTKFGPNAHAHKFVVLWCWCSWYVRENLLFLFHKINTQILSQINSKNFQINNPSSIPKLPLSFKSYPRNPFLFHCFYASS